LGDVRCDHGMNRVTARMIFWFTERATRLRMKAILLGDRGRAAQRPRESQKSGAQHRSILEKSPSWSTHSSSHFRSFPTTNGNRIGQLAADRVPFGSLNKKNGKPRRLDASDRRYCVFTTPRVPIGGRDRIV